MNLELRHIRKAYGDHVVLEDLSRAFPEGRVTCVMGRSGCGKTTLLRLIAGLEAPDAGEILGRPGPKEGVAMVFQESRLPPQLNAAACLRCALPKTGGREARIDAALRALGLAGDLDKPVREFSGGMRQRVSLARALLYPSPLILLDEPFKGLDAATRDAALAFARPLLRGRTALLVTHDPADAAALDAEVFALDATAG